MKIYIYFLKITDRLYEEHGHLSDHFSKYRYVTLQKVPYTSSVNA